ncbi:MAG: hypothetical protein EOM08_01730 [Clostridia bacterium]|nr:hypothetical protein [Clostridia bacterium]NCC75134.1 hypothetical protein [Clostridia bacterium]
MTSKPYPPDFWDLFEQARARARESSIWNTSEMHKQFAAEQSGISDELYAKIEESNTHEQLLLMFELYKLMVVHCTTEV